MSLIDKLVEVKNKGIKKIKKHSCLHKILSRYFANKRYGCQFLDEQNRVLEEYTLVMGDRNIMWYESGIKDVWYTMGVKKSFMENQFKDVEKYFEHPLSTVFHYLPRYPFYLIKGDIKFGRTKK